MSYDYAIRDVLRVVDGDTCDLSIDLGLHLTAALRFRILNLDTPERGQPGWAYATEVTHAWLATATAPLRVTTHKADSFGRWLGFVYDEDGNDLASHVIGVMDGQGIDARWRG